MLRGLIFLVALSAGGIAAWITLGTSGAVTAATNRDGTVDSLGMTEILVAAVDLPSGAVIDASSVSWQRWPDGAINPAFITRAQRSSAPQSLAGMIVRNGMVAGEPVHDSKLSTGDAGALAVMLASGKRAIAVRINSENSAGGFVLPNDRVDVLLTTSRVDASGNTQVSSRLILKNIKVLAVDQTIDGSNEAVVGKTATLELSPPEVEIVTAAQVSGALSLALRSLSDIAEESMVMVEEKKTLRIFRGGQIEVVALE